MITLFCACTASLHLPMSRTASATGTLSRIDRQEETYLALEAQMPKLGASLLDLSLPDLHSRDLFDTRVRVVDLAAASVPATAVTPSVTATAWPLVESTTGLALADLALWRPLLERVAHFEHVRFHIVDGRFTDDDERRFLARTNVQGAAILSTGEHIGVSAVVDLLWARVASPKSGSAPPWKIAEWRTHELSVLATASPPFEDVLERAIADASTLEKARTSLHHARVRRYLADPDRSRPHDHFELPSLNRHPGVSVVDIDSDGLDDIYVMARWGPNLLLRNLGNGRFEDVAPALGLDIEGHTSSAIFADFDNDGDPDAFLGRTLEPSVYLVNEGGRFIDRSHEQVDAPLPALISSVTAADYDGDGLLDLYLSSYSVQLDAQEELLPPEEFDEIQRRRRGSDSHLFRNRPGPVNVLLKNVGSGRFSRVPAGHGLDIWRNTFHAGWSDHDGDGDPDLYLANDFAPNNLMRNDGDGRFTDVTAETGTADVGFGMGVSWGDYDLDGDQDLYVTNMYSSAGRRITRQMGSVSEAIAPMAHGNSLFRNDRTLFTRVSGLEPPALPVEKAGWGWGSQFLDIDNDGDLDIYAPAGFYTAPRHAANPPDL